MDSPSSGTEWISEQMIYSGLDSTLGQSMSYRNTHFTYTHFTFFSLSALSGVRRFSTLSSILPHFLPCFSLLSMFFLEPLFAYPPNLFIMDLVSWSLNVIDQIFSTGTQGKGEPSCPDGTFFSGFLAAVEDCVPDNNVS
ncbi:hypothetical protein XENOCAPTIV_023343 [Xenoophorus captivus]|uniref:Uncharacterized protein n=1 Tax=Xenoophorus captivus TaxID=1517983 RepID=A0ABV0S8E1_9TELE